MLGHVGKSDQPREVLKYQRHEPSVFGQAMASPAPRSG